MRSSLTYFCWRDESLLRKKLRQDWVAGTYFSLATTPVLTTGKIGRNFYSTENQSCFVRESMTAIAVLNGKKKYCREATAVVKTAARDLKR
jgi:hypothetical protein